MTLYARACRRLPKPVVDWSLVLIQAILIIMVVLYSDEPPASFQYLNL